MSAGARMDGHPIGHRADVDDPLVVPPGARVEELPFAAASVTRARELLVDDLNAADVPRARVADANIVVGELVMNAIRHGHASENASIEVSWWIGERTAVFSVRDAGHVDHLEASMPDERAFGGRGLAMVAAICERWSHDKSDGTRVTAELSIAAA